MYWFLDSSFQFLFWLLVAFFWSGGGWLIVASVFRLNKGENLLVGFGVGLVGYLWFINLLGHWMPPDIAFSGAGGIVFLVGLGLAWKNQILSGQRQVLLEAFDLRQSWPVIFAAIVLSWIFLWISQGVGMFDEFTHLPLISLLATGDIPPHFIANSSVWYSYHYGFQLLGASMMRLGGLFPWSAFDLSKSILWGYAIVLAWLVGQRFGRPPWAGWLPPLALIFASGTRYLLLLAPRGFLTAADPLLTFQGNEADVALSKWMIRIWDVEGEPPIGLPYAFTSGITEPLAIAHAGLHILHIVILLLCWLLADRVLRRGSSLGVFAVLFSLWALTWETSYVLFLLGGGLATLFLMGARYRTPRQTGEAIHWKDLLLNLHPATWALLLSVPIAFIQGGLLTEIARGFVSPQEISQAGLGLSLRWPPAILSKHLGPLNLLSPITLIIAIVETGPIIFFFPWITKWAWQKFKGGEWVWGALLFSAWLGFLIPIIFNHRANSDLSRVAAHAMLVFIIFFSIQLTEGWWPPTLQTTAVASLALMMFGGIMLFGVALTAGGRPMIAAKFTELDALVAKDVWDRLPKDIEVFDPEAWNAIAVTGSLTHYRLGDYFSGTQPNPVWDQLRDTPTIEGLLAENFAFVYINEKWWRGIPDLSRSELESACVVTVSEHWSAERDRFRKLIDLRGCQ